MSDEKMTKAERLYVAGQVAPTLRAQSERASKRVVKVYDQETGEVVRHATLADVQRGILETAKIELDVTDGTRPTHVACELCGRLLRVEKGKVAPKACRGGCDQQQTCAGWGETEGRCEVVPPRHAFFPFYVRQRDGEPYRCKSCSRSRLHAVTDIAVRIGESHKARTHCRAGHEFTEENTRLRKDRPGNRVCVACERQNNRAWRRQRATTRRKAKS